MKKIPKDLLPSKKFKLKCPACSYKNKLSKNLLISVYKILVFQIIFIINVKIVIHYICVIFQKKNH